MTMLPEPTTLLHVLLTPPHRASSARRSWIMQGISTLAASTVALAFLILLPGCAIPGGVPAREPDATGVVRLGSRPGDAALIESSDSYFEGVILLSGRPPIVRGQRDARIEASDLEPGDRVEVWVGDVCAESCPVQCEIEALRVLPWRRWRLPPAAGFLR
ncbi:hypothetical protein [Georgenia ruanii]|uniref:hypothetical protein n=1 Tax=Georgenia ruanii TaxID=348442 RepID=UPI00186B03E5|nr:hypothetical protein [Georgenia ruanii]